MGSGSGGPIRRWLPLLGPEGSEYLDPFCSGPFRFVAELGCRPIRLFSREGRFWAFKRSLSAISRSRFTIKFRSGELGMGYRLRNWIKASAILRRSRPDDRTRLVSFGTRSRHRQRNSSWGRWVAGETGKVLRTRFGASRVDDHSGRLVVWQYQRRPASVRSYPWDTPIDEKKRDSPWRPHSAHIHTVYKTSNRLSSNLIDSSITSRYDAPYTAISGLIRRYPACIRR